MKDELLSVVIPMYCEEDTVLPLYERLDAVLAGLDMRAEIVFVDDGSIDGTVGKIRSLAALDARVRCVELSRNFGLAAAVTAGLDNAGGDAVVLMDGDLQDPPELIPEMVEKWREGHQVVNALKGRRPESLPKRLAFRGFYAVMGRLTDLGLPPGAGLFSLMDRCVVRQLRLMREQHRFMAGLRWWLGFSQCTIVFDRERRYAGQPRQSLGRLVGMALDGILSFSSRPLMLALWLGFAIAALSTLGIATILYVKLATEAAIPGWASTMVTTLFMGAVQLIVLGILGAYVGRMYDEMKGRPIYVTKAVPDREWRDRKNEGSSSLGARRDGEPALVVPGTQASHTDAAEALRGPR